MHLSNYLPGELAVGGAETRVDPDQSVLVLLREGGRLCHPGRQHGSQAGLEVAASLQVRYR